jgi:hypothetical protein
MWMACGLAAGRKGTKNRVFTCFAVSWLKANDYYFYIWFKEGYITIR